MHGAKRTVENLIDEMTETNSHWTSILAVARMTRRGEWYDDAIRILQERGIMPTAIEDLIAAREEVRKRFKKKLAEMER